MGVGSARGSCVILDGGRWLLASILMGSWVGDDDAVAVDLIRSS